MLLYADDRRYTPCPHCGASVRFDGHRIVECTHPKSKRVVGPRARSAIGGTVPTEVCTLCTWWRTALSFEEGQWRPRNA